MHEKKKHRSPISTSRARSSRIRLELACIPIYYFFFPLFAGLKIKHAHAKQWHANVSARCRETLKNIPMHIKHRGGWGNGLLPNNTSSSRRRCRPFGVSPSISDTLRTLLSMCELPGEVRPLAYFHATQR